MRKNVENVHCVDNFFAHLKTRGNTRKKALWLIHIEKENIHNASFVFRKAGLWILWTS
jgi:hypothetical protein